MKNLSELSKKELLHELFAANTEFLMTLKSAQLRHTAKQDARAYLSNIIREVERRKTAQTHFSLN